MKSGEFAAGGYFFTSNPNIGVEHPVMKQSGILETVHATDIDSLMPGSYGYKFFTEQVDI